MNYQPLDPIEREERRKRAQAAAVKRWKQKNPERVKAYRQKRKNAA